jgi:hypothetical protein
LASSRTFFLRRFSTNLFLQSEVVSLTSNPQHWGPGLRIYTPWRQGCPAYPLDTGQLGYLGTAISHTHLRGPLRGSTSILVTE